MAHCFVDLVEHGERLSEYMVEWLIWAACVSCEGSEEVLVEVCHACLV